MRVVLVFFAVQVLGAALSALALAHTDAIAKTSSVRGEGGKIAFWRSQDGGDGGAIWVMNADGTSQRRLTREDDAEPGLTWSPDGRRIAFETFRGPGSNQSIWRMRADGAGARAIRGTTGRFGPAWSPDGRAIAMSGILVMNPDGSDRRRVVQGWGPSWSPDGRMIVFSRDRNSSSNGPIDLFLVDLGSKAERRLTHGHVDRWPAWSPDGRLIAFDREASVYVMDIAGRNVRRLGAGGSPSWSPDGRKIVFTRNFTIWEMNSDGSAQHRVSPPPGRPRLWLGTHSSPEWSPVP